MLIPFSHKQVGQSEMKWQFVKIILLQNSVHCTPEILYHTSQCDMANVWEGSAETTEQRLVFIMSLIGRPGGIQPAREEGERGDKQGRVCSPPNRAIGILHNQSQKL